MKLGVYKANKNAELPSLATEGSAAFDLRACLEVGDKIKTYSPHNKEIFIPVKMASNGLPTIQLMPQFRTLVPTGLIFDIPQKYEIDINIRSSMALKYGLTLANNTGIIDSDYVDPTFIIVYNMGDTPVNIYNGDRIAQGRLKKTTVCNIEQIEEAPGQKTDREGGFGSTGVN